jgi:hypothetical protein
MENLTEFTVIGENGKKETYNAMGMFENNGINYIVYEDATGKILASRYKTKGSYLELENDLTEEEFDLVDKFLNND